jgi:hypothetical protein
VSSGGENDEDDVREYCRQRTDVRNRDLGVEGIGGGGESAREIFEMGFRSGQRNSREHGKSARGAS